MTALTLLLLFSAGEHAPTQALPEVRVVAQSARPDMVLKWNEVALQTIAHTRTPPPVAARNLAIMHIAIYDTVMALKRTHDPYLADVIAQGGESAEVAVAAAAHRTLVSLYPKQRDTLDGILLNCWEEFGKNASANPGVALGRFVGDRVLDARKDDGAANVGRYEYKKAPGSWRPTAPRLQDPLLPEWGWVKPFAIKKGTQYRHAGPAALTSAAYADAFEEVKRLGGKQSAARTEDQTRIAHFWADDVGTVTPPGHWNRIAQSIAQDRGTTLAENARIFAHLNISLADAGILCWVIKFTFDFWRPITAIQEFERNDQWTPLLDTPPFPAYVSGHSTFSSAAASSLANSFGTDKIRFSTTSDGLPGMTRTFDSLWSAAQEAGMSRVYGGIHWQFDNVDGLQMGRRLGEYVARHTLQPRTRQVLRPAFSLEPPPPIIIRD